MFLCLLALSKTSVADTKFVCSLEETRNYIHRLGFYFLALTSDLITGFCEPRVQLSLSWLLKPRCPLQPRAAQGGQRGLSVLRKGFCMLLLAASPAGCAPTKARAQLPRCLSSTPWFGSLTNGTISQTGWMRCCQCPRDLLQRGTRAEYFLEAATNGITPQLSLEMNWTSVFLLLWSWETPVNSTLPDRSWICFLETRQKQIFRSELVSAMKSSVASYLRVAKRSTNNCSKKLNHGV